MSSNKNAEKSRLVRRTHRMFCCHIYCAQLGAPWGKIAGASRAVSNRESRYPPSYQSCRVSVYLSLSFYKN